MKVRGPKRQPRKHNTTRTCRGKRRYRDQREATEALHRIATGEMRQKTPCRVYECPTCRGFHLTSRAEWR